MTTTVTKLIRTVSLFATMLLSLMANAQAITVADYVSMDLQARQVTLDGVKDRLVLMQLGADLQEQLEEDAETQAAVDAIYSAWGTTAAKAVAWATRHHHEISQWLENNVEYQQEYDRIEQELDNVSAQIQALSNGQ